MPNRLHPIESPGLTKVARGEIRVERFEDRLEPRVPFPHKHDFYQVVIVTGGRGWHEVDFVRHPLTRGHIFFIKPDQVHEWKTPGAKGFVIEFSHEFNRLIADTAVIQSRTQMSAIESLGELMIGEFERRENQSQSVLAAYLEALVIQVERAIPASKVSAARDSFFLRFQSLIEKNFREHRQVEFYAKALGVTAKALTMRIKRSTGRAARDFILDRAILEAKRRLVESAETIAEIGYGIGFEDPNYFARFFKERAGVGPSEFRSQKRKS